MEIKSNGTTASEKQIIAGLKVIESEVVVQRPIFEDVKIERPIYVNKQVEVPTGTDILIKSIVETISELVLKTVASRLDAAISARIKEIEVPRIIYKEEYKTVSIDRPVYNEVTVDKVVYKDKEVINPVLVNQQVINAVIKDAEVVNAVLKDRIVINPVFEDVVIQKPKFVEKEIVVIHPKYIDMKGNPEP